MKVNFSTLLDQTPHTRSYTLIDTEIVFFSSSRELVGFLDDEIVALLPAPDEKLKSTVNCIIESHSSAVVEGSALPEFSDPTGRYICPPELGPAMIFVFQEDVAIVVEKCGTLYHSGGGDFLLYLENDSLLSESGGRLNIQGMLNILLSEILLLSNKLLAHAGGVGKNGQCQIWTGESGAGKTTRIISQVSRGYDLFGDDQVVVGKKDDGEWYVWPYWLPVKVKHDSISLEQEPELFVESDSSQPGEKIIINDIGNRFKADKPEAAKLQNICLLIPGTAGICEKLDFEKAFQGISKGFMHSLFPGSSVIALELVLALLEDISVHAVSWDKLELFDQTYDYGGRL